MRIAASLLVLAAALSACAEPTAPKAPSSASHGGFVSQEFVIVTVPDREPPPPLDTNFVASTSAGSGAAPATFFVNKTGRNAYITFQSGSGVTASPNARLHFLNNGTIQGTGSLTFAFGTLDLANSDFTGTVINGACAAAPVITPGAAVVIDAVGRPLPCATIPLTRAVQLDGTPITGVIGVGVPVFNDQ